MNSFSVSFKAFALVALLSTIGIHAMQNSSQGNTPSGVPASHSTHTLPTEHKKGFVFTEDVCKAWDDISKAVIAQKNRIVAKAAEMKTRGWSKWNTQEKAGVVIGGTLVAATAVYLVYKVYQSFTTPKTKKPQVKRVEASARPVVLAQPELMEAPMISVQKEMVVAVEQPKQPEIVVEVIQSQIPEVELMVQPIVQVEPDFVEVPVIAVQEEIVIIEQPKQSEIAVEAIQPALEVPVVAIVAENEPVQDDQIQLMIEPVTLAQPEIMEVPVIAAHEEMVMEVEGPKHPEIVVEVIQPVVENEPVQAPQIELMVQPAQEELHQATQIQEHIHSV